MKIFIIGGPTASGKSELALELMKQHKGHIINADSLQVYPGLPILTAQPKDLERHFLYGTFLTRCTVALWREKALDQIENSIAEGFTPIIVGGTGFYLKALIEGLSSIPPIDKEIKKIITTFPPDQLFEYACSQDPLISEKLKKNDLQRIKRALEVYLQTKKSIFEWQSIPGKPLPYTYDYHVIKPDRSLLYERINQRFLKMIEQDVIQEVKNFPHDSDNGVKQAIGYQELKDFLDHKISLTQAIDLARMHTRQYAKKQMTWFRSL